MSEIGQKIIEGLQDAIAYMEGSANKSLDTSCYGVHTFPANTLESKSTVSDVIPDIKSIRADLGLTQIMFASQFGFSVSTLRNWEQGKRKPDPAVRAYLRVIAKAPDTVRAALAE